MNLNVPAKSIALTTVLTCIRHMNIPKRVRLFGGPGIQCLHLRLIKVTNHVSFVGKVEWGISEYFSGN